MRAREFILENKVRPNIEIRWDGNFTVDAYINGKRVGSAEFASDDPEGRYGFYAISVGVDPMYRRMGVATAMYDAAAEKFGEIIPSEHQTDDARAFWQSYGKEVVGETKQPMPQEVAQHLQYLTPDDVGVDEVSDYRIHFEGFTDFCKSSSDYCANPEAVYQEVFSDFIAREGGQKPLWSGMVGDEEYPILYSVFKDNELTENLSNSQVLRYVKKIHPDWSGSVDHSIMNHEEWELINYPVSKLQIADPESEDGYIEDPYNRILDVDMAHVQSIKQHDIKNKPIVVDTDGYIIDGNHRAMAAKLSGMTHIPAYVPYEEI